MSLHIELRLKLLDYVAATQYPARSYKMFDWSVDSFVIVVYENLFFYPSDLLARMLFLIS